MPAYNCEAFIAQAISSVRKQTHEEWDLIVVDDCSSDGTGRVARAGAERDSRVKLLAAPVNGGSSSARNLALAACTGDYVAFLDADDMWVPEKLARQLEFMEGRQAGFSFTAYRKFDDSGPKGVIGAKAMVSREDMLKGNRIGCSTVVLDAHVYSKLVFATELGRQEDYALWLSLLRSGGYAYGLNEPLTLYRVHKGSKSSGKLRSVTAQWRVYRDFEKLPRVLAIWYMAHYAARGVLKALR